MSEGVVHVLEVIEIEEQRRHDLTALRARHRQLQPLVEQDTIGQVSQRVVLRHVRDLGVGAPLRGDVLVGDDPATVLQVLMRDAEDASIGETIWIVVAVSISRTAVRHSLT